MSAKASIYFDSSDQGGGNFIRVPRCFFHKNMTSSQIMLGGMVYSFSSEERVCRLAYKQVEQSFNVTAPTVARAFRLLKENGRIKQVERDKNGITYKFVEEVNPKESYDIIPHCLHKMEIVVNGVKRRLKNSEKFILGHFIAKLKYSKKKGFIECSIKDLADRFGFSDKTVRNVIYALLRAGVIYRHVKGVNRYKNSVYAVNKELFAYEKKRRKVVIAQEDKLSAEVKAANRKAERERYYDLKKEREDSRIDKLNELACAIPEYKQAEQGVKDLQIEIAKAEVFGIGNLSELKFKEAALKQKMSIALRSIGLKQSDFTRRYTCDKCHDTGEHIGTGMLCDCWKRE